MRRNRYFAYIGVEHEVLGPNNFENFSMADGTVLQPGDGYYIQMIPVRI